MYKIINKIANIADISEAPELPKNNLFFKLSIKTIKVAAAKISMKGSNVICKKTKITEIEKDNKDPLIPSNKFKMLKRIKKQIMVKIIFIFPRSNSFSSILE